MAPAGIESERFIPRRHSVVPQAHPVRAEAAGGTVARAAVGAAGGQALGEAPQGLVHPMVTGVPAESTCRARSAGADHTAIGWGETEAGDPRRAAPRRRSEDRSRGVLSLVAAMK
jgi:hypothetical protein